MKSSFVFLCMLANANANLVEVSSPVQKVVSLLAQMLDKARKAKQDEKECFAREREELCQIEIVRLTKSIEVEEQAIVQEKAEIQKDESDAKVLGGKILQRNRDIFTWTAEKSAAIKERKTEKTDYATSHKDYSESIAAVDNAIGELKKQSFDRKQAGSSLAQVPAVASLMELGLVPAHAKRAIDLFLQQGEEESALPSTPASNAYEFQSSGVIDMLEKLQDKFIDEKTNIEKEEANAEHSHGLMIQELEDQISQAEKDIAEGEIDRSADLAAAAHATIELKEEKVLKKVDTTTLIEIKSTCAMKATDFESRQNLRDEEVSELQKVMEMLSSGSLASLVQKHLPALQKRSKQAVSFVSMSKGEKVTEVLRSLSNTEDKDRVVEFLRVRATKSHSRVLSAVADRAAANPFEKVKKMLKDLVVRLMEEANEESVHKGWCDKELGTNAQTRKEKTDEVESLNSAIDELSASIQKLTFTIKDLTKEITEIDKAMAEATEARKCEHIENTDAILDSQEAQTAIAQATNVLKSFYASAAQATSLVQVAYQGLQEDNAGVLAHLEIIEADFARMEAEAKASEATAQKLYDEYFTDAKVDKASKTAAIEHKKATRSSDKQTLTRKTRDLEDTQNSLDKALTYFEKLKPSCVDAGVSYEDRVQRRKEEIESLQEALRVMNGEDLA